MTTSGTNNFTLVMNEIIAQAFAKLGAGSEGEDLSDRMYADGKSALNLLVKTWSAMDHLWKREQGTVMLIADQAEYTLSGKPLRLYGMRRKAVSGGYETPMTQWSRQQYLDQSNKGAPVSSIPVNFYYDPQRTEGDLYLWPAPSTLSTTQYTLIYDYITRLDDMLASNDEADVPAEWLEALVYNLAVRLMPAYPVNDGNLSGLVIQTAKDLFAAMKGWDNESTSLFLQPDYQAYGGYGYYDGYR